MFSQNVIDPREFITDPSDSIWDSQQNSQAWGISQSSNSQIPYFGNSSQNSGKQSNELQTRQQRSSLGSDYWSQSQNITQPLQENDDGRPYHLKYLQKPVLLSPRIISKNSEEKQPKKPFHHYVEMQRKKSFDSDSSNKLDAVLKTLKELSYEFTSNAGSFRSEIGSEITEVLERLLCDSKLLTEKIDTFTAGDGKYQLLNDNIQRQQDLSAERFDEVKKRIMHLNDDVAHIRENISDLKEAWKQKEEKVVERNAQTESLLSEILSKLAKGKPEHNESTQTDKAECYENSTQSLTVETRSLKIQTDKPIFQHNTSKNLYYPDVIRNPDPVLPMSPASRPIKFSEKIYPSPVATVAPLMRKVEVKEEAPSDDEVSYDVRRRRSKRPNLVEKREEASSIFMFDISTDDSEENVPVPMAQLKSNFRLNLPKEEKRSDFPASITYSSSNVKQRCNGGVNCSTNVKTSVQKEITSYGKIKKGSASECVKKEPFMKESTRPTLKDNLKVSSRGYLAQKRKKYAESVVCFDDYADVEKIQLKISTPKKTVST